MRIKKIFTICFIALLLLTLGYPAQIRAKTPTPSPTVKISSLSATPSDLINKLKQIQVLKEKIATKVAEIREKEKRAVSGVVKAIEQSTITIAKNEVEQTITISDDTIFYTPAKDQQKSEASSKNIKIGNSISIFGYATEENNKLSAKYIFLATPPVILIGKIADIDKEKFTITVKERLGNQLVDVETSTKSYIYNRDKGKQKIGFSKLKIGDRAHIIGSTNLKEQNRVTATNMLILPAAIQPTLSPTADKEATTSISPKVKATVTPKAIPTKQ